MPDYRTQILYRFRNLQNQFLRKPDLKVKYQEFMAELFRQNHASFAGPRKKDHSFYIPHFPVFGKSGKLRVVFDASAKYKEVSLNSRLLQGPDQLNNLFGVLLRWRRGQVAVNCDIQKMFHSFFVTKEDREYLRFFWVKGDDPNGEPVECVANVHIFGARSSPAVANFALRKAALLSGDRYCDEVKDFVFNNFYVDDGLLSADSSIHHQRRS